MSHKLNVWLFTKQVGTLGLVNGRLNFEYTQDWLHEPNATVLSCSLPLQRAL